MRRLAAILLLLTCALLPACDGSEEPEAVVTAPPVTVAPVQSVDLTDSIRATGELIAKDEAAIAAEVGGQITEIRIDEGQRAASGDVVVAIDPERRRLERDRVRAALEEARANLAERERDAQRVKELFERGVASQSQLDEAETALKLARSRVDAARAELGVAERSLRDAWVRAPFDGLVDERFVSRGGYVNPGQNLFRLVSLEPLLVEFRVTEVQSARVHEGQEVAVRVAPYPDRVFRAQVSVLAPTIDPRTRTLLVKAELPNEERLLRPGLFARVDLGVAHREGVLMVPEEAVLQRADGSVVFRMTEGERVERILVETGTHEEGSVEVVKGLSAGDVVVSRGHAALVDGARVAPRQPDGSSLEGGVAGGVAEAGP